MPSNTPRHSRGKRQHGALLRPYGSCVRDVQGALLSLPVTEAKRSPEGPGPKGDAQMNSSDEYFTHEGVHSLSDHTVPGQTKRFSVRTSLFYDTLLDLGPSKHDARGGLMT